MVVATESRTHFSFACHPSLFRSAVSSRPVQRSPETCPEAPSGHGPFPQMRPPMSARCTSGQTHFTPGDKFTTQCVPCPYDYEWRGRVRWRVRWRGRRSHVDRRDVGSSGTGSASGDRAQPGARGVRPHAAGAGPNRSPRGSVARHQLDGADARTSGLGRHRAFGRPSPHRRSRPGAHGTGCGSGARRGVLHDRTSAGTPPWQPWGGAHGAHGAHGGSGGKPGTTATARRIRTSHGSAT